MEDLFRGAGRPLRIADPTSCSNSLKPNKDRFSSLPPTDFMFPYNDTPLSSEIKIPRMEFSQNNTLPRDILDSTRHIATPNNYYTKDIQIHQKPEGVFLSDNNVRRIMTEVRSVKDVLNRTNRSLADIRNSTDRIRAGIEKLKLARSIQKIQAQRVR
ncbi:ribosomal protein S5 [Acrasis kona]|uniref:Ribosomal protein S5 n=1 Tax=Acrasis kona TaxID=1008807 RepID=A0AAW2ZMF7_9EUKA